MNYSQSSFFCSINFIVQISTMTRPDQMTVMKLCHNNELRRISSLPMATYFAIITKTQRFSLALEHHDIKCHGMLVKYQFSFLKVFHKD